MFWIENYKHNKQKWLEKCMWMIVKYDKIILVNEKLNKKLKEFDLNSWEWTHFPNAINIIPEGEETIRLTTGTVYPLYDLIKYYKQLLDDDSISRASFDSFENENANKSKSENS